jgi:hypothetical protein
MDQQLPPRNKGRETLLTFTLVALLGGAIVFFLNFVTLGVFSYVIVAIIGIAVVGFLHYAIWGYALSRQVAGEREEQRIKDILEADQGGDETMPWKHD